MSFGSFSLSRSWTSTVDYARLCVTVALIVASNACIGLGFRLLRWSRVASGLPFSVFAHCLLEPFDWERSASGTTFSRLERLYEDSWLSARVTVHGLTVSSVAVLPISLAKSSLSSASAMESDRQASPSTLSSGVTVDPARPRPYRPKCNTRGL